MKKNKFLHKNKKMTLQKYPSYSLDVKKRHSALHILGALLFVSGIIFCAYTLHCVSEKNCTIHILRQFSNQKQSIKAPKGTLSVEVVDTSKSKEEGLSGRASLPENQGMLFVFNKPGRYGWWAKDMLFSTDIIWIDEDGYIVEIERDVSPDSYPKSFINTLDASYVLEINAGVAKKYGLYLGLKLALPK